MAKKSIIPGKGDSYNWTFANIGGVTRVTINTGEDIAHLGELDQKLWTVLSCPVKGLEFDEETLRLMDTDNDGKIRVGEVVAASQWLCSTLKDKDLILRGDDQVALSQIDGESENGAAVLAAAQRILERKAEDVVITMDDVAAAKAAFDEKVKAKDDATAAVVDNRPYGDNTDDAIAAVNALKNKVADYFMRCKLIAFDEECSSAVDVSVEKIQAISELNLSTCSDKIADYPLARPVKECRLTLGAGINPPGRPLSTRPKRWLSVSIIRKPMPSTRPSGVPSAPSWTPTWPVLLTTRAPRWRASTRRPPKRMPTSSWSASSCTCCATSTNC